MTLQIVGRSPVADQKKRLEQTVTVRASSQLISDTGIFVNGYELLVFGLNTQLDNKGRVSVAFPNEFYPYQATGVLFYPARAAITEVCGFQYVEDSSLPTDKLITLFGSTGTTEAEANVFGELYLVKKEALFPEQ